ncbi:MAG: response regulator [Bacteroidetes bacterium]|nr:response regulator [Bacteroidota bacterium]
MINILLADDHEIMLDGYISILQHQEDINIIGTAANGREVLTVLEMKPCDVLLLDINMPLMDGLETAKFLRSSKPGISIIVLTMLNNLRYIHSMVDLGVSGYVLKSCGKSILLEAIRTAARGEKYFDEYVTSIIKAGYKRSFTVDDSEVVLSERETDIIRLVALGLTTKQIADELFISPLTVQTHRKNINFKLQLHSPSDVTHFAFTHNLLISKP